MKFKYPINWLVGLKTLARSDQFQPFVVWISAGEHTRRLLVPHPSTLRFPRSRMVQWNHGKDGKCEFDPRHVLKIDLQIHPEELLQRIDRSELVRPHQRKRVLLPEYEAMMAEPPGDDVQAALDEIRGDR